MGTTMREYYDGELITRIGPCALPEESRGYWRVVRCEGYTAHIVLAGGWDALRPLSSFTNMERSDRGEPFIFTCWGTEDGPAFATGGLPSQRGGPHHPCRLTHAVWVSVPEPA